MINPKFHLMEGESATIRFLASDALKPLYYGHYIAPRPPKNIPDVELGPDIVDSFLTDVHGSDLSFIKTDSGLGISQAINAAFPNSDLRKTKMLEYDTRTLALMNAFSIEIVLAPIPVRKKKSWMRYTSQKKWANRFPKRFTKIAGTPKVIAVSKPLFDKITALSKSHSDLQKLGRLKRLQEVQRDISK